ncbi:MAG: hypothetical protein JSS83_10855 [Cyanobacteria bacterium SZAS LIN-3]|nr:hypothetical protein [Cyanobacteria bacterium SZAS LIN-3]MBS2006040.1 hypothetical protein [Cyanobacteria bacterium SZAS TMP-1]
MANFIASNPVASALPLTGPARAKDTNNRLKALPPTGGAGYSGRVSTFYNQARATYCETYEPPRKTVAGDVWRLESRMVAGRWLHMAYSIKGEQLNVANGKFGMYEQSELPLLFDPEQERTFARTLLDSRPGAEKIKLAGQNLVYGSGTDGSVGIVRVLKD